MNNLTAQSLIREENAPTIEYPSIIKCDEITYRNEDAISQSLLKQMSETPRAAQQYELYGMPTTPAMALGTAIHTAVLEPELFESQYAPPYPGKVRRGKEYEAFKIEHGGKKVLTATEYDALEAIQSTVARKECIQSVIATAEAVEAPAFWVDRLTGLRCKGKADAIGDGCIFDVKTTTDLSDRAIQSYIAKFGADVQGAFYLDGFSQSREEAFHSFILIFIQTKSPFEARVLRLPDEWVALGRTKYRKYIADYKACKDEFGDAEWPGYEDYMVELAMPTWLKNQEQT